MAKSAARIRQEFLDFFKDREHTIVPSAPVVPHDDPTLLFTNAGMNQFKDVFLAQGTRDYSRAADTQKCIRAGGKHNDLEDVGKDTYHHTFFEMLGNWSLAGSGGDDYFKEDAIKWAWELLTEVWKIDPERLYVTVFEGNEKDGVPADTEAEEIWAKYVPRERIMRFDKKDNFWEMGETGPCGPCSEIHYDATPDKSGADLVNKDDPRVIEVWNLVFIQFNRGPDGTLTPLPHNHVDTGMGFERITRVLQGKDSNYDTDIFTPIFESIEAATGARPYSGNLDEDVDTAYRIIADHMRCLSIAIADGAQPSNEGRGYVLRRILRRAVRHAHQTLGVEGAVLDRVVSSVVETLGDVFPELKAKQEHIEQVIKREEESFLETISRGLQHFGEAAAHAGDSKTVAAQDAFKLHDTYGFPIDLTRVMAEERGMTVDEDGFNTLMEEARERSRAKDDNETGAIDLPPDALARLRHLEIPATDDVSKYFGRPVTTVVRAIWNGTDFDNDAHLGRHVGVILERTPLYAEQGGQVADHGTIRSSADPGQIGGWGSETHIGHAAARFNVTDCRRFGEYILHIGAVREGKLEVGDRVIVDVEDSRRDPVKSNHTATHLLNLALRQVIGDEVEQKGSLVAPDRLRFDFSSPRALEAKEINAVERLVNAGIHQKLPVHAIDVPLETALKINGVRAVFGEKYPDPVRVVSIGPSIDRLIENPDWDRWRECSIEFCGGTHLANTSEAKRFVVVQETALAAGVRRIVAVTGPAALAAEGASKELEARLFRAQSLQGTELVEEVNEVGRQTESLTIGLVAKEKLHATLAELRGTVKQIQKESQTQSRRNVVDQARVLAENIQGQIIVESLIGADSETLRAAGDVIKSRRPDAACMLFAGDEVEMKVSILALVPQGLIEKGLKAGDWVKLASKIVGGGGGGRPDMAQAGGKDPGKITEAIEQAKTYAEEMLSQSVEQ